MCRVFQGCHVALLGARDLAAGAGISRALNATMRQFSGLNTEADDLEARMKHCRFHCILSSSGV